MKRLLLLLSFLLTVTLHAQTEKGQYMVGANFNPVRLGLRPNYGQINLYIQPSIGKFVCNNLAVGTRLGVGLGVAYNRYTGTESFGISFSPSVFGRYYVPISKRIKPFVELESGFTQGFARIEGRPYPYNSVFGSASVGASIFLSPKASIDMSLGYRANMPLSGDYQGRIGSAPQVKVGFNFFFPGKKKQ